MLVAEEVPAHEAGEDIEAIDGHGVVVEPEGGGVLRLG